MNAKSSYKVLLIDLILFLLSGGFIWAINIFGQSIFPGNNLFPFFMRSLILAGLLIFSYYLNYRFTRKSLLNNNILKFKSGFIKLYLGGSILSCLLIATIWVIIYIVYPFEIITNSYSVIRLATDIISYSLGNTLEELLFRGFLLVVSIKLLGRRIAILFVSLLFGLFHLQGIGVTKEGLNMVITTFTMSLLFISVIYYTKSIWTAVTLHITGNLLLHTAGFDGANNGMLQIRFFTSSINRHLIFLIYEIVVILFALFIFYKAKRQI